MSDENALVVASRPDNRSLELARERLKLSRKRTATAWAALRDEISEKADWHTWYRAQPALFLGAAFLTGYLLGRRR